MTTQVQYYYYYLYICGRSVGNIWKDKNFCGGSSSSTMHVSIIRIYVTAFLMANSFASKQINSSSKKIIPVCCFTIDFYVTKNYIPFLFSVLLNEFENSRNYPPFIINFANLIRFIRTNIMMPYAFGLQFNIF